jgi:hypothetical protein
MTTIRYDPHRNGRPSRGGIEQPPVPIRYREPQGGGLIAEAGGKVKRF